MTAYEWEQDEAFGTGQELAWEEPSGEVYELEGAEEFELASELLEITSEEELDQFLGSLVKKVARGASAFVKSPIGKALGGVLKNVAKTALPMVGSAVGSFVAPGIGTAIGGKLGSMASNLLEAEELERMDEAEAELEAARRYVRWASGTIRNAARAPRGVPPRVVVRTAAVSSARRYAPALLRTSDGRQGQRVAPWRRRRGPAWGVWGGYAPAPWGPYAGPGQDGWDHGWDQAGGDQDGWDQGWNQGWNQGGRDQGGDPSGWGDGRRRSGWYDEGESGMFEAPPPAPRTGGAAPGTRSSGQWTRRGNRIVVHGV